MPTVSPLLLLAFMLVLTGAALAGALLERFYRNLRLRRLASERGWTYAPGRDEPLERQILPHLPLGAADVRLLDRLQKSQEAPGEAPRIVARVDFCLGSVGHRRNTTCILRFVQSSSGVRQVVEAEASQPWLQQYRRLIG